MDRSGAVNWVVYVLRCKDGTLYTGSTNDLEKRVHAHNHLKSAAKYTRARRPVEVVYTEKYASRIDALKRETSIKRMSRREKLKLIGTKF